MTQEAGPGGAAGPNRRFPSDAVPVWMQGIAAIVGVILTGLVVFGVVGRTEPSASPSPGTTAPSSAPVTVSVVLTTVTTSASMIRGVGSYSGLNPATDVVLFMGQPVADQSAQWLPVTASTTAETTAPDGRESGRWQAERPNTAPGSAYTWYAVIAPKPGGAADPYADLRQHGLDSDLVVAASQPFTTGD